MMGREKRRSLPLSLSPYPSHLALPLSVPISPCVLLARCMKTMKTTGDESAAIARNERSAGGNTNR